MEFSLTVLIQVAIMFLLIAVGYLCGKIKLVGKVGVTELTNVLLYVVSPLVIIDAYQTKFNLALLQNLGIALLLAVASHVIAIAVSYLFIRRRKGETNDTKTPVERFAVIYSNCGFMALPLISALFGSEGVFYASAYITIFNILSWTHGYILMSGKADKTTIKNAFLSPVVIAVFIGLLLFFLNIKLPYILGEGVRYFASLNTPLAMLIFGINLSEVNLASAFTSKRCWYIMLLNCLVIPLVAAAIYLFLPISNDLLMINLVATACPPAVISLLFATKHGKDAEHASKILTLSNISCIITIPLIIFLFQYGCSLLGR